MLEHGFKVMMSGFLISVLGLIVYMSSRFQGTATPRIAFGVTIAGFCIYVIGRVFVAIERKRSKNRPLFEKDDDDLAKE